MVKEIEVVITLRVPADGKWNFIVADALRDIGSEIYINPSVAIDKGESLGYTYEYSIQGKE
jgi:hypothetical protein